MAGAAVSPPRHPEERAKTAAERRFWMTAALTLGAALAAIGAALAAVPPAFAAGEIFTLAGNGRTGFTGDGGRAVAARLNGPVDVTPTLDGGYLIADEGNDRVRFISAGGRISTAAGSRTQGYGGDGGPAIGAALNGPSAVALTSGGYLIADRFNNRIRAVLPDGRITTVAGAGAAGLGGDGGPATAAQLNLPADVAPLPDGGFLIADTFNNRVRRVSAGGVITTVAGAGSPAPPDETGGAENDARGGFAGDGGPATSALLDGPEGVAPISGGGFLIADTGNDRIRLVGQDGTIRTVAGGGIGGDGLAATAAALSAPRGLAVTSNGSLLIADTGNDRIRRVTLDGRIATVAGGGRGPDGGAATAAALNAPADVTPSPEGGFLLADSGSDRVRGVPPFRQLVLVIRQRSLRASTRGRARLPFAVSSQVSTTLDVLRGRRRVARLRGTADQGRRSVGLPRLGRGLYALRLGVRAADGQVAVGSATLRVTR